MTLVIPKNGKLRAPSHVRGHGRTDWPAQFSPVGHVRRKKKIVFLLTWILLKVEGNLAGVKAVKKKEAPLKNRQALQ